MKSSSPKYSISESIQSGDNIKYAGETGTVDLVITNKAEDWDTYWKELGEGVMLKVPSYKNVYVPFDDEDLEFVSRKETKP